MARISRHAQIILKQEALALDLLQAAEKSDNLDMKMDLFERVGKWVSIKNKLENDDGGGIADYKRRLHAESSETDKHPAARRSRPAQANGGSRLDAIKSRIPQSNDGGSDRFGSHSGVEDSIDDGHGGGNGIGLLGHTDA